MESKKNPNKDLYRKSDLFLIIGFCISVGLVITAFEWRSPGESLLNLTSAAMDDPYELMNVAYVEPPPPQPKPRPINIVVANPDEPTPDVPLIDQTQDLTIDGDTIAVAPEPELVDDPVLFAEDPAMPVGGLQAFYSFVAQKMKGKYPHTAVELEIEGKVFVEFIVEKDGKLTAARIVKGIGGGCDELALQTVLSAPPWKSARQGGKPVRQRFTLPIFFRLK